ncbi:MAG: sterol desaturase family protein, partial [Sphingomonas sp.]
DMNYGNWLIIWDRMFGTFEKERETVVYGLTQDVDTNNPWRLTWLEWRKIAAAIRQDPSLRAAMHVLFAPPETAFLGVTDGGREKRVNPVDSRV